MAHPSLKILMVTSEAVPLAKAGGLGDVIPALSSALRESGADVRILMPRYYFIDRSHARTTGITVSIRLGWQDFIGEILETLLPGRDIPVYLLENELLFGRDGIYGSREEPSFHDNLTRFSFLSRAVFPFCREYGWIPDVLHCHDWPTALVPVYRNRGEGWGQKPAVVFTIHNLGYQGVFPFDCAGWSSLSYEEVYRYGLARGNNLNLMQGALLSADLLTTVSPSYAREIQTPEQGDGLDEILRSRSSELRGILNGIDYGIWNPETDPYLPFRYSAGDLSNKARIKAFLQREVGLPVRPAAPLFGMVSRMVEQKGFVELCNHTNGSMPAMLSQMDLQFVVLGSGERWIEETLSGYRSRFGNIAVRIGFDDRLAHLIEAGSDFFLMPSRYEPCGLNQLYSLRYGTLPIVRRTGGLADTVENYCESSGEGTGFVFDSLSPSVLYDVVGWASHTWFNRRSHINRMRKRAMSRRFSWEDSARHYLDVYREAIGRRS